MLYLLITILLLFVTKRYFPIHKTLINRTIIGLTLWLITGTILGHFLKEDEPRHYSDVEYAQAWIKDNPKEKGKIKIQDDGTVLIQLKKRKYLKLKDGVLSTVR